MKPDAILVLDFGGQYCHLIARRVREQNVYSELVPNDITSAGVMELGRRLDIKGMILSGGPSSVYGDNGLTIDKGILGLGLPMLGICYGHQLLASVFGGRVERAGNKEFGIKQVEISSHIGVLKGLKDREKVWMSHGDTVSKLPAGFKAIASSDGCPVAAFADEERKVYGLQWHPEVVHTESGALMLKNFVFDVCKCEPNWKPEDFIEKSVKEIKETVGEGRAIVALSGGIDSSTAAAMTSRAIGKNLTAVFVDHGFMRKGEPDEIRAAFSNMGMKFIIVDARERFFGRIRGVTEPEQKRKIIGEEFIRVFEDVAKESRAEYLIQGTIYPDRIESGISRHSDRIKAHHNVGGLPFDIRFKKIIEPLRDLYKDEVRKIAGKMGLPDNIIHRFPFPGPGLAIRIVGEVTEEKLGILREADAIVAEEVERSGLGRGIWQAFAYLLSSRTVGVKGDGRSYGYTIAIRCVESVDAMTADWVRLPYDVLQSMSTRILNEVDGVGRVLYDISQKPPSTVEPE